MCFTFSNLFAHSRSPHIILLMRPMPVTDAPQNCQPPNCQPIKLLPTACAGGGKLGSTCLWHFIARFPTRRQVSLLVSPFSCTSWGVKVCSNLEMGGPVPLVQMPMLNAYPHCPCQINVLHAGCERCPLKPCITLTSRLVQCLLPCITGARACSVFTHANIVLRLDVTQPTRKVPVASLRLPMHFAKCLLIYHA